MKVTAAVMPHKELNWAMGPSLWGRGRLRSIYFFQRASLWPKGSQESMKKQILSASITWSVISFTMETGLLVFRTQCLELRFLLLVLEIEQYEKKKAKAGIAQMARDQQPQAHRRQQEPPKWQSAK